MRTLTKELLHELNKNNIPATFVKKIKSAYTMKNNKFINIWHDEIKIHAPIPYTFELDRIFLYIIGKRSHNYTHSTGFYLGKKLQYIHDYTLYHIPKTRVYHECDQK